MRIRTMGYGGQFAGRRHVARAIVYVIVLSVFLVTGNGLSPASAQDSAMPSFSTDRPGIGDSAYIVPPGYLQFESGVTLQHDRTHVPDQRVTTVFAPNMVIRIGLLKALELRFLGGDFVYEKTHSGNRDDHVYDVSAPTIATKLQLTQEDRFTPQTAFFMKATLPFGSKEQRPDDVTPSFKVAANYAFSEFVSWEANLGVGWENGVQDVTGAYTTALGLSLSENLSTFAEVFGNLNGPATHGFDAGLTYLLSPTLQFDVSGGPALTSAAPDWFIAAGISFRLPRLW